MTKKLIKKYLIEFILKHKESDRAEALSDLYFEVLNEVTRVPISNFRVVFKNGKFIQYGRLDHESN